MSEPVNLGKRFLNQAGSAVKNGGTYIIRNISLKEVPGKGVTVAINLESEDGKVFPKIYYPSKKSIEWLERNLETLFQGKFTINDIEDEKALQSIADRRYMCQATVSWVRKQGGTYRNIEFLGPAWTHAVEDVKPSGAGADVEIDGEGFELDTEEINLDLDDEADGTVDGIELDLNFDDEGWSTDCGQ